MGLVDHNGVDLARLLRAPIVLQTRHPAKAADRTPGFLGKSLTKVARVRLRPDLIPLQSFRPDLADATDPDVCIFYTVPMTRHASLLRRPRRLKHASLSLQIGTWFGATATGWGVVALPVLVLVLAVCWKLSR